MSMKGISLNNNEKLVAVSSFIIVKPYYCKIGVLLGRAGNLVKCAIQC